MTQLIEQFVDQAESFNDDAKWLGAIRKQGIDRFNLLGIPDTKNEDWKYTNLRALARKQFSISQPANAADSVVLDAAENVYRLTFENGVLNQSLSMLDDLPAGVQISSLQQALAADDDLLKNSLLSAMPAEVNAFASLNIGLFRDGALIRVSEGCKLDKPVELVFISQGSQTLSLPRNLILIEKDARAQVIERQLSDDESTCLSNSATEILLKENAKLDYNLIQLQGKKATHIGGTWVQQAADSEFSAHTITLGGQLVRNELSVSLNGQGAHADCTGLYYGRGRQHIDNHTTIKHCAPACTSRELYKGILDDRARGVFHGRIKVEQIAQLTEADQQNANLLLSRDAEIDTKPQLEIYADDVKCAHGATVGELDKKQLFYLQTRGITLAAAKTLLTYAFAAEVVDEIKIKALRESLTQRIAAQMHLEEI
jgi:Fe-S cluster assembly protein SufD